MKKVFLVLWPLLALAAYLFFFAFPKWAAYRGALGG